MYFKRSKVHKTQNYVCKCCVVRRDKSFKFFSILFSFTQNFLLKMKMTSWVVLWKREKYAFVVHLKKCIYTFVMGYFIKNMHLLCRKRAKYAFIYLK